MLAPRMFPSYTAPETDLSREPKTEAIADRLRAPIGGKSLFRSEGKRVCCKRLWLWQTGSAYSTILRP